MFAVEALSSYISRGVNTVSGPFHPFGGAVDIVVVEQQDGSYKSSPWYVRFGKFQGVLKAKEKVVNISVDGVIADFHMYLDHTGVAYFLREVDAHEMTSMLWRSSSELQTDVQCGEKVPLKSKSCNYSVGESNTATDMSNGKIISRTRSDGSEMLGIVFESQSTEAMKVSNSDNKDKNTISLDGIDNSLNDKDNCCLEEIRNRCEYEKPEKCVEVTRVEIVCSASETSPLSKNGCQDNTSNNELNSQISRKIDEIGNCEVSVNIEKDAKDSFKSHESLGDENCSNSFTNQKVLECENGSSNMKNVATETYSEKITVHPSNGSATEDDSCSVLTISASKSIFVPNTHDSQEDTSKVSVMDEVEISRPNSPEEEQFMFSDLDEFKPREVKVKQVESMSVDHLEKENHPYSLLSTDVESANESLNSNSDQDSPKSNEESTHGGRISSHIDIPKSSKAQEVGSMIESLPTVLSDFDDLDAKDVQSLLTHSLDSNSKTSKWLLIRKDVAKCIKSARDEERCSSANAKSSMEGDKISEELANANAGATDGDPSKSNTASSGSWRLWPFSLSRIKKTEPHSLPPLPPEKVSISDPKKVNEMDSKRVTEPGPNCNADNDAINSTERNSGTDPEEKKSKEKIRRHTIRENSPTSEQLMSLNLKEGRNTVTFTFLTSMLGEQQVDASIYLWRWDARIVISDVDGTITKSDILGQFMPLVGKDWSHTGVVHLFSAIKENGYHMLFLSARSISQAYLTRQFLFNLKQDGVALPDGPVVISPDGLFPSLFREVIRRAPHEFKIACLEDIKALFPKDRNPFYAGFGNRDTDEISYLKVGIPKGKIFIVNPRGEVVVNRSIDTKSYTSLKTLVSRMFPHPSLLEPEDYNNWNFWKLSPPSINL